MKINKKIRIKVIKSIIIRLERDYWFAELTPYGIKNSYDIYVEIVYWEKLLEVLKKK